MKRFTHNKTFIAESKEGEFVLYSEAQEEIDKWKDIADPVDNVDKAFFQGYACAIATLIRSRDIPGLCTEAFYSGIGSIRKCEESEVDKYDLDILRKYYK